MSVMLNDKKHLQESVSKHILFAKRMLPKQYQVEPVNFNFRHQMCAVRE